MQARLQNLGIDVSPSVPSTASPPPAMDYDALLSRFDDLKK
jgi:hypothetical protein